MGNCCGKKITEFWKRTPMKNVENKSLTPVEYLEGSDGCYDNNAIPMRAVVFVTPKYVRKFPKFTMPPFFRVSKSTSLEDFNQSSSHAGGISSNQNQVTSVSSSATQYFNSTLREDQQSVSLEHPLTRVQDSSESDQRLLEHHPLQTTSLQSASETGSRQHLSELEQHQSSLVQSLPESESKYLSDSKNFRKLQTLSRNIEIAKLDGISEVRDGAIVFLPPKYVKNFLESSRPPSINIQLTHSNSTENFNQTFTNSTGISSDLNQITPESTSANKHSTVPENQQLVSSEHALITDEDSSESVQHLSKHELNPTSSTQSSKTESMQHLLEIELHQSTYVPSSSETESRQHLLDSTKMRKLQIPAEDVDNVDLDEIEDSVLLTLNYDKNFQESTTTALFDDPLANSNSTHIINRTSSNAAEISSYENQITEVSSSATQHSSIPEHQHSVSLEQILSTAQNPSESEQSLIEPESRKIDFSSK